MFSYNRILAKAIKLTHLGHEPTNQIMTLYAIIIIHLAAAAGAHCVIKTHIFPNKCHTKHGDLHIAQF